MNLCESTPDRIATLNDPNEHDDNRQHKEDVHEASERVGRGDPEQPENDQNNDQC